MDQTKRTSVVPLMEAPVAGARVHPYELQKREEQQRNAASNIFDKYDKDKSGTIDIEELPALADFMGLPMEGDDIETTLTGMDKDGSGKLEKEEYIAWWLDRILISPDYRRQQEVIASNVFSRIDESGDGKIDMSELAILSEELGIPLSQEELKKAMKRLDTIQDGTLEQAEFVSWWIDKSMNWEVDDELSKKLRKLAETARRRLSTDVHTAVWQGDIGLVEEFLKADPSLINAEDTTEFGNHYRSLHYAAYQGNLDLCKLLVQNGAKVMVPTKGGATAVFLAAQQNHPQVVDFLLGQGADPTVCETSMGLCAVDVAEYCPEALEVFKAMNRLSKPSKETELPLIKANGDDGMELTYRAPLPTEAFVLPIQELKVKICKHARPVQEGESDSNASKEDEEIVRIAIVPSRTMPVVFKKLAPQASYSVSVACINGLGAGEYGPRSNIITIGSDKKKSAVAAPALEAEAPTGDKENQNLNRRRSSGSYTASSRRGSNSSAIGSIASSRRSSRKDSVEGGVNGHEEPNSAPGKSTPNAPTPIDLSRRKVGSLELLNDGEGNLPSARDKPSSKLQPLGGAGGVGSASKAKARFLKNIKHGPSIYDIDLRDA